MNGGTDGINGTFDRGVTGALGLVAAIAVIGVVACVAFIMIAVMGGGVIGGGMMDGGMMGGMMGDGSDPSGETAVVGVSDVRLENIAFSPASIVVDAGTTVTWTNYDSAVHTVKSDAGDELASPLLNQGNTFSHTFDVPGEYYYHCEPHPNMKGLVTVRPA
jgi:plastocyanin